MVDHCVHGLAARADARAFVVSGGHMADLTIDLQGFDRIRLVGDEDCGVGLECRDCWDGGRPLAYLRPNPEDTAYTNDAKVTLVDTAALLLVVGRAHLDQHHTAKT